MEEEDKIQIGDWVDVYLGNTKGEFGVQVEYIPVAIGDSWIFQRVDRSIVYVQNFTKIVLPRSPRLKKEIWK